MAIKTVPNQKIVNVQKQVSNKQSPYAQFNLKALELAIQSLSGESFKLWCYINKNQNGYTFALSKVDALNYGIGSSSSYSRAVKQLIDKGYLVQTTGNNYTFYEIPRM